MPIIDVSFYELILRMVSRRTGEISRVAYMPQKPAFSDLPIEQPFPRATPESQGISSEYIRSFLDELQTFGDIDPHHVMILRNGVVITECAYAPFRRGMWHITHSLSKSITGMAIGCLVNEGKLTLDEKLTDIFPKHTHPLQILRSNQVTVRDLLVMGSAVEFSESGAFSGNDWVSGFLSSSFNGTPGAAFDYNSMNSYMLSAIVTEKTGQSLADYIRPRLLDPLGIREFFWEACPRGISKGGWGAYLKPEDAAKLGQLYLQKGLWRGVQLIPESWVGASTSKQIDNYAFGYGYQIWMEERPGSFMFNGMFGQDVLVLPDLQMVIVVNAGNAEIVRNGSLKVLLRKYFGASFSPPQILPADGAAKGLLDGKISELEGRRMAAPAIARGGWKRRMKEYGATALLRQIPENVVFEMEAQNIGLFPLLMQVMHNNFTDGIRELSFSRQTGGVLLKVTEGDETLVIPASLTGYAESEISIHGEIYRIAAGARLTTDEDEWLTLVLDICFLEGAARRSFRIHIEKEKLRLTAAERPGERIILDNVSVISDAPQIRRLPFIGNLIEKGGYAVVLAAVKNAVCPTDYGHIKEEEHDQLLRGPE